MYKDLKIWHHAMDLLIDIYKIADSFPKSEEYNLKSQIKRAIVSVPLNIAEGKMRGSNKDFAHFLNVASGSLTEVEVIIEIAQRLQYIDTDTKDLIIKIKTLNKMITSLRKKLLDN